jgi:hypothetical protein
MFKCRLWVVVNAADGGEMFLVSRHVELPFPPYPGLQLLHLLRLAEYGEVDIDGVSYDVSDGTFDCELSGPGPAPLTQEELEKEFGTGWEYGRARVVRPEELPEDFA